MSKVSKFLVFFAFIFCGISAYSQEEGVAKIRIGIGSFEVLEKQIINNLDVAGKSITDDAIAAEKKRVAEITGANEKSITEAFTKDGRFVVSKVSDTDSASDVDYVITGNDGEPSRDYTTYLPNPLTGKTITKRGNGGDHRCPITATDTKTGKQVRVVCTTHDLLTTCGIKRFPSQVFPLKIGIENISNKGVELHAAGGGTLFKGDVCTVYAEQKEGNSNRKSKLGELVVKGLDGGLIICKFDDKNSAKQITAAFNSGVNLLIEGNENLYPKEFVLTGNDAGSSLYSANSEEVAETSEDIDDSRIHIHIGAISGDYSSEVEQKIISVLKEDGGFAVVKADNAEFIVSGTATQKDLRKKGILYSNAGDLIYAELTFTVTSTGKEIKESCFRDQIGRLIRNVFPVECEVKSVYPKEKEVELLKISGGKADKNDAYIVYSDDGKKKIGRVLVAEDMGTALRCKIKDGSKEIIAAYNSGASLSVEFVKRDDFDDFMNKRN